MNKVRNNPYFGDIPIIQEGYYPVNINYFKQ